MKIDENLKDVQKKRRCFFCEGELAKWQPEDDTICNKCANEIKQHENR